MIYIFLPCREKAHENEFCREKYNLVVNHESPVESNTQIEHSNLGKKFELCSNLGIPANKIKCFPYTTNKYLRDGVKIYLHFLVSHRLLHLKLSGTINVSSRQQNLI